MKGAPIALVTAGFLSLAFMGFTGLIAVPWQTKNLHRFFRNF